jgi:hypothetical protein
VFRRGPNSGPAFTLSGGASTRLLLNLVSRRDDLHQEKFYFQMVMEYF